MTQSISGWGRRRGSSISFCVSEPRTTGARKRSYGSGTTGNGQRDCSGLCVVRAAASSVYPLSRTCAPVGVLPCSRSTSDLRLRDGELKGLSPHTLNKPSQSRVAHGEQTSCHQQRLHFAA